MEGGIDTPDGLQCSVELILSDAERLRELAGELAQHFKVIGRAFDVRVDQRGEQVVISGADGPVALVVRLIGELYDLAGTGFHLHPTVVEHACRLVLQEPDARIKAYFTDVVYMGRRNKAVFPRSANQRRYIDAIRKHDVVFGLGPAGTGKTYLAVAMALSALMKDEVQRIVLCRPAVEAGEKLGFLPGDLIDKVNPYLRPLYDSLHDLVELLLRPRAVQLVEVEVAAAGAAARARLACTHRGAVDDGGLEGVAPQEGGPVVEGLAADRVTREVVLPRAEVEHDEPARVAGGDGGAALSASPSTEPVPCAKSTGGCGRLLHLRNFLVRSGTVPCTKKGVRSTLPFQTAMIGTETPGDGEGWGKRPGPGDRNSGFT